MEPVLGKKFHVDFDSAIKMFKFLRTEGKIEENENCKTKQKTIVGDNSVSLRRIWTKLEGNPSYKPPEASYTAQGSQKQPEILKTLLYMFYRKKENRYF